MPMMKFTLNELLEQKSDYSEHLFTLMCTFYTDDVPIRYNSKAAPTLRSPNTQRS